MNPRDFSTLNPMNKPTFSALIKRPVHFLAFGFGSGLSSKAPGTMGTAVAIVPYLLLAELPLLLYMAMLLATFLVGVYLCHRTASDLGVHDHPGIVWDEFVGYWLTMFMAPPGWLWIVIGFVWFRFFDVLKPWPISWCDKHVHGGFGIMLDDVLAGLMALLALQLCVRLLS